MVSMNLNTQDALSMVFVHKINIFHNVHKLALWSSFSVGDVWYWAGDGIKCECNMLNVGHLRGLWQQQTNMHTKYFLIIII